MGKKGSWLSAVKKALTPSDSKEKKDKVCVSLNLIVLSLHTVFDEMLMWFEILI